MFRSPGHVNEDVTQDHESGTSASQNKWRRHWRKSSFSLSEGVGNDNVYIQTKLDNIYSVE